MRILIILTILMAPPVVAANTCYKALEGVFSTRDVPKAFKKRKDIREYYVSCMVTEVVYRLTADKKKCVTSKDAVTGIKYLLRHKHGLVLYGIRYHCKAATRKEKFSI